MPLQRIAEPLASDDFPAIVLLHLPSPSASLCGILPNKLCRFSLSGIPLSPTSCRSPTNGLVCTDVCFPLKVLLVTGTGWWLSVLPCPSWWYPSRLVGYLVAGRQLRSWIYNTIMPAASASAAAARTVGAALCRTTGRRTTSRAVVKRQFGSTAVARGGASPPLPPFARNPGEFNCLVGHFVWF